VATRRTPFEPQAIAPGVFRLAAVGCWVHVLADPDGLTLIDVGLPGSARMILRQVQRLGYRPSDVRRVLLSHFHIDHIAGVPELLALTPAQVFIHRAEAEFVRGEALWPNPIARPRLPATLVRRTYRRMMPSGFAATPLDDGDVLPVRGGVRVVHVPGHTPGSAAYLAEADGMLFTGDALQHRFRRLAGPSFFFSVDPAEARRSIGKMAALDFETLCFAHFPPLPGGRRSLQALAAIQQSSGEGHTPTNAPLART
jgi:glyoxylase-like metal-dependent hydrolase (beta-lactamase superfamily II)